MNFSKERDLLYSRQFIFRENNSKLIVNHMIITWYSIAQEEWNKNIKIDLNLNTTILTKILKYFEWNSHIDYIKNKISNITGVLYNCRQYLNTKTMVNFYYTFFYPYVIYKIKGWSNTFVHRFYTERVLRIINFQHQLYSLTYKYFILSNHNLMN